ncbi:MAG: hypothetical protein KDC12_07290, partial [Flavobacteriales bacterium]|nr:hypothetical protein [Flavobacteriales bacterium]
MKSFRLSLCCWSLLIGISGFSQLVQVYPEVYAVDGIPGYTTYHIFAELEDSEDFFSGVWAFEGHPIVLGSVGNSIYNDEAGAVTGDELNTSLCDFVPSVCYDSFVTIGWMGSTYFNGDPIPCGMPTAYISDNPSPWVIEDTFSAPNTSNLEMNDGGWYAMDLLGCNDNGFGVGPSLKVLLAQITIPSSDQLIYKINVQVFDNNDASGGELIYVATGAEGDLIDGSAMGLNYPLGNCLDPLACNYNLYPGYDEDANACDYSCYGCMDSSACNYDSNATSDNDSCIYFCPGCTDSLAVNYDPQASEDDGSCIYAGCINPLASNYNPNASLDDGSCDFNCDNTVVVINTMDSFGDGWSGATWTVANSEGVSVGSGDLDTAPVGDQGTFGMDMLCLSEGCYLLSVGGGSFDSDISWGLDGISGGDFAGSAGLFEFYIGDLGCIAGCTDPAALNYESEATLDDGSCTFGGCIIPWAINYDSSANENDGSCIFECDGHVFYDGNINGWFDEMGDDLGLEGITVILNPGNQIAITDINGFYSFGELGAGEYQLTFEGPSEYPFITTGGSYAFDENSLGNTPSYDFGVVDYEVIGFTCEETIVELTLTDAFGDGWNGGLWEVIDAFGETVQIGNMSNAVINYGTIAYELLCLTPGCYTFNVGGGTFDSEIGWTLDGVTGGDVVGGAGTFTFSIDAEGCIGGGCTDPEALNYNSDATFNDGSCLYEGCTVSWAVNYDSNANVNDGSCIFECDGYVFYDGNVNHWFDDFGDDMPLQGQTVVLNPGNLTQVTDENGYFNFGTLAPGNYTLSLVNTSEYPLATTLTMYQFDDVELGQDDNYNFGVTDYEGVGFSCDDMIVQLTMNDSFGDGWNGATWELTTTDGVSLDSGDMSNATISGGSTAIELLCLPTGCYIFNVGSGTFDSEISWLLDGVYGGQIFGGAPSSFWIMVGIPECNPGCTDPNAPNYDSNASYNDGSCIYPGCIVPWAYNFDPQANEDDGSCEYAIAGYVFYDGNLSSVYEGVDPDFGIANQTVVLTPGNISVLTDANGFYSFGLLPPGEYEITLVESGVFPDFTTPTSYVIDQVALEETPGFHFGLADDEAIVGIDVNIYPASDGYPCNEFPVEHDIYFTNIGNQPVDAIIQFEYDAFFVGYTEITPTDSVSGNTIYWSHANLYPGETASVSIILISPDFNAMGVMLYNSATVYALEDGEISAFGEVEQHMMTICSWDPNDKQVFPAGYSEEHFILPDTDLDYRVRFQ